MSDFDREERAFRGALAAHAMEAPVEMPSAAPATATELRRPWWAVSVAAVAVLVLGVVIVPLLFGRSDRPLGGATRSGAASTADGWRWVSYRTLEVQAPADWAYGYSALRPDCIGPDDIAAARAGAGVPHAPYVMVGGQNRPSPATGCPSNAPTQDPPDPAFGALPFALWQPFVQLDTPSNNQVPAATTMDGRWDYHQWRLTRATIAGVQVTVLSAPQDPSLGTRVIASARTVQVNSLGCRTDAPIVADQLVRPSGPALPATELVSTVTICEYARAAGAMGLEGSRQLTGDDARALLSAIRDAPPGTIDSASPAGECTTARRHGVQPGKAITLRFYRDQDQSDTPVAEANVYYDECFGSGIVDSERTYALTGANCHPLFSKAPVVLWYGTTPVATACGLGGI